jgi:hypothetical protein
MIELPPVKMQEYELLLDVLTQAYDRAKHRDDQLDLLIAELLIKFSGLKEA